LDRLWAALLFLFSTTLDGVDGELARLKIAESRSGARLDTLTDNLVHVALFAGIMVGCYRASGSASYFSLLIVLLGGFFLCALTGRRATRANGDQEWIAKLERLTGRDFAYLLVVLALFDRVHYFAWATTFGTYVFAFFLWRLTTRRWGASVPTSPESSGAEGASEYENRGLLVEIRDLWHGVAAPPARRFQTATTVRPAPLTVHTLRRVPVEGTAQDAEQTRIGQPSA
jgi:phosphatidylglycerophosphate synthase